MPRRLPNDSIVVARFAGAGLAERDRDAAAWEAEVFLVGARFVPVALPAGAVAPDDLAAVAFFAGAFLTGAVFAAVALAVGRRAGVAVAETAFLRATRELVGVGLVPGVFAAVAPVARFAAVAAFFAATFRGGGPPLPAPVRLLARAACAIVAPCRICRWRRVFPAPRRSNAGFTLPWWRTR
ncbi:hypothetical protein [Micromonospora sp. C95]|uniref:hypothetical protein n=1 Tax=Micromonospora sp. C95 TaxID=2824882 RepID=UPI001B36E2B2|nr:hypothetical protein [Micromonospora sp. C95]MBQ1026553.1 hypothetical protein [Micromonospora sp. C95]